VNLVSLICKLYHYDILDSYSTMIEYNVGAENCQ
jgi:hypothetical protein